MPISDFRDHLADVVNRAVYGGEETYLTRRGRRLAVVVSATQLAAERVRAKQQGVVEACTQMWQDAADADDATREAIRSVIDKVIAVAEDAGDVAAFAAARDDHASGVEATPWDEVKAELGL